MTTVGAEELVLSQPDDQLVAKLREVVRDLHAQDFDFATLIESLLSEIDELTKAARAQDYRRAAASAATIAATGCLLYGQGLVLAMAQAQKASEVPPWKQAAPTVDPRAACAFDMRKVEQQPRVKAGDWVNLPNGDRVLLRTMPKNLHPETFVGGATGPEIDHPDLLFYRYQGQLHMGAINGHCIIGLAPEIANLPADVVRRAIAELTKTGKA